MGNAILESIKNKVNKVHAVLDFSIPTSKVVEYSPGSNNKPLIRDKHTGIYIGKMLKEEEGVYNDATLHGMFKFAGENKQGDSQFHIYIGSILYETLAGADYKKEILSLDEQKKKIQELARKANIAPKSLHIHNLGDSHRELFDGLKSHGLEALNTDEPISAINDKTTSLDIAKLLYYTAQTRPLFKKKCMELTPHNLLENLPDNHPLTYYGMVECAFRITDALHGITTQGGLRGQKRYDEIIERILSGKTAIPVLDKVFKQRDESPTVAISKRYFKNDIYKKLIPQEEEKKKLKAKARNVLLITTGLLTAALLGGSVVHRHMKEKEKENYEKAEQEFFKKYLGDKTVSIGFNETINLKEDSTEKAEILKTTTNNIYYYFQKRYATPPAQEHAVIAIIKNELCKYNKNGDLVINNVNQNVDYPSHYCYDFIENILIKNNLIALKYLGCSITPYQNLLAYREIIENTLLLPHKKTSIPYHKAGQYSQVSGGNPSYTTTPLGVFTSAASSREYDIILISINIKQAFDGYELPVGKYLAARTATDGVYDGYYDIAAGQDVAKELLQIWHNTEGREGQ